MDFDGFCPLAIASHRPLLFLTDKMKYQSKSNEKKIHTLFTLGYYRKKNRRRDLRMLDMEFPGVSKK